MDINTTEKALAVEDDGIDVEILDPSGEPETFGPADAPTPLTIKVAGRFSKRFRKAEEWQRNKIHAKRGKKMTGAESLQMLSEFVARCTISWPTGAFTLDGKELSFSVENATTLYSRLPHVQAQVEAGMDDHAGFIAKNSSSSAST